MIVAIPDEPDVAVTVTLEDPLKSSVDTLPAVPTTAPLWFLIVRPPIAPVPDAVIPVRLDPSPKNVVAVVTPLTTTPLGFA